MENIGKAAGRQRIKKNRNLKGLGSILLYDARISCLHVVCAAAITYTGFLILDLPPLPISSEEKIK
jgi:hypothetical protein